MGRCGNQETFASYFSCVESKEPLELDVSLPFPHPRKDQVASHDSWGWLASPGPGQGVGAKTAAERPGLAGLVIRCHTEH